MLVNTYLPLYLFGFTPFSPIIHFTEIGACAMAEVPAVVSAAINNDLKNLVSIKFLVMVIRIILQSYTKYCNMQ